MSAIFGIYNINGKPVHNSLIERMSNTLSHRGSDNKGIWTDKFVGFGHRMLCTTQESIEEKLPKSIDTNNLVITADARIDNREDLLKQLELKAFSDQSISDSEIILYSYRKWGEDCPQKLLGDFAFVIWDKQKQKMFCARDQIGVKSLYYYYSKSLFVFGTEIKALLCVEDVPRELNELRIGNYLTSNSDDVSSTFYKNIYRLPAGHQMSIDQSGKRIKTYWSLDPYKELKLSSNEEYAENFREIFFESVRCRMRSIKPIGSMLSGGLDSSSVACVARELMLNDKTYSNGKSKLHTFSAIFEKVEKSDESFYINSVLRKGNFEPHYLIADQESPLKDLEKFIWHMDEAIQPGNLYINWNLYKAAQQEDVGVILDGFDGDSTVSHGQVYLLELAKSQKWIKFTREARGYAKNFEQSALALVWAYYWRFGFEPLINKYRSLKPARRIGKKIYKRALAKDTRPPLSIEQFENEINPEFIKRTKLYEYQESLKKLRVLTSPKNEREAHYLKISDGVIPYLLEVIDKASAPFNVEVRYPFCDKRLIEFCLSLPAEQKMQNGLTRIIMRRAMEGILPKEVQWRPGKSNLSYGFENGLQNFEYKRISKVLEVAVKLLKSYSNVSSLVQLNENLIKGKATDIDIMKISSSVSLALWLQRAEFTKEFSLEN